MIRKLKSGSYRLYSRKKNPTTGKRRNLGTFKTRAAAKKHEQAVQYSSVADIVVRTKAVVGQARRLPLENRQAECLPYNVPRCRSEMSLV
jgi:hypothetical protein